MPPLFLCKKREKARLSPKSVARGLRAKRSKNSGAFLCVGEREGVQPFLRKNAT